MGLKEDKEANIECVPDYNDTYSSKKIIAL